MKNLKVIFDGSIANLIAKDPVFAVEVDNAIKCFNFKYAAKWVGTTKYDFIIAQKTQENEVYLEVFNNG